MNGRAALRALIAAVILAAGCQVGAAQTQPQGIPAGRVPATAMAGGDAAHDGRQPGPPPTGAPAIVWSGALTGPIAAAPVVADGFVYVPDASGVLQALDAGDGYPRWQFAGNGAITAPAAVDRGLVVVDTASGEVDALDATTGAARWRAAIGHGIDAAPVVANGVVYVGATNGQLSALDAAAGTIVWQATAPGAIHAPPTAAGGLVVVSSADGSVTAFAAATGARRWSVAVGAANLASPAFADGQITIAVGAGRVLMLDAATGRERWRAEIDAPLGSTPAIGNGLVYILDANGGLRALDAATGRQRWASPSAPAGSPAPGPPASPALAGSAVIYGSANGDLIAANAATGKETWRLPAGGPVGATPAVVGGVIYASLAANVPFSLQAIGGTGTNEAVSTIPLNPPPPPGLPARDRRLLIEDMWQLVREYYLYPDYRGVDWDGLLKEYEPKVLAAPTTEDAYALVEEFVTRLNNPHCYLIPPWGARELAATWSGQGTYAGVGVFGSYEAHDLLVLSVFPGSPAARAGIAERDRIIAVDGVPVSAAAVGEQLGPSRAYSLAFDGQSVGPGGWAIHDRLGLRGPVGSTVRVTIQPPNGPARDVTLTRALVTTRFVAESRRLAADPTIGYVRIPTFFVADMATQVEAQLRALLADPRPLRGLVIDVRANPGGFNNVADAITGQFVSGDAGGYVDRSGARTPHTIQAGDLKTRLASTAVVVLTDADSISNAEGFAAIVQSQGRAKVVGMRTPGVTESTQLFYGPGGLAAAVPVQATLLANGVNLEGKGVTPDVTVSADWTRFDEASDPDIRAAVALLAGGGG